MCVNVLFALAWIASSVLLYLGIKKVTDFISISQINLMIEILQYDYRKLGFMTIMLTLGIFRVVLILAYGQTYYNLLPISNLNFKRIYLIIMPAVNAILGAVLLYFFICVENLYIALRYEANVVINKANFKPSSHQKSFDLYT